MLKYVYVIKKEKETRQRNNSSKKKEKKKENSIVAKGKHHVKVQRWQLTTHGPGVQNHLPDFVHTVWGGAHMLPEHCSLCDWTLQKPIRGSAVTRRLFNGMTEHLSSP